MAKTNEKLQTTKELVYVAVFVALLIGVQYLASFLPGVELVSLLLLSFSFVFGVKKGVLSAFLFAILRQFIFGFYLSVFLLYIIYYPLFALSFGLLGKRLHPVKGLWLILLITALFLCLFTFLDIVLAVFFFSLTAEGVKGYALASLPILVRSLLSVLLSVAVLFYPLQKTFSLLKKGKN